MQKKLTQTDLQRLFELAYNHWQAHNWDDAMEAELVVSGLVPRPDTLRCGKIS